jgi:hypothetical protein
MSANDQDRDKESEPRKQKRESGIHGQRRADAKARDRREWQQDEEPALFEGIGKAGREREGARVPLRPQPRVWRSRLRRRSRRAGFKPRLSQLHHAGPPPLRSSGAMLHTPQFKPKAPR